MMIGTTMRFHTYQAPNDGHNCRDAETIERENAGVQTGQKTRWIDPQGVHVVLGPGQTLREGAEVVFGGAIDAYNAKQTRQDRKMTVSGYLDSVEHSRRGRPVKAIKRANERAKAQGREGDIRKESGPRTHYEIVLSLGNVKPLRDPRTGKVVTDKRTGERVRPDYVDPGVTLQIVNDYLDGWAVRNPNLYLFRGDFHNDEWYRVLSGGKSIPGLPGQWLQGEAHAHLDFIAFGEGYQRGPQRQASITKALAAMGYVDYEDATGHRVTAWEQWQAAERDVLQEIARGYGYEIRQADDSREALSADEYAELADLREAIRDAKAELAETEARTADLDDREDAVTQREQELDEREAAIKPQEQALEEQRQRLRKAADLLEQQKREAADLDDRLPRLRRAAKDAQEQAKDATQEAETAYQTAADWAAKAEALRQQETALQASVRALQGRESAAYKDAQERGYRDGYAKGAKEGEQSAMGQMYAQMRRDDGEELTREQRIANMKKDGIGPYGG